MLNKEEYKCKYLQRPITFLTEENLDELETHCRKAVNFERGVEHKVVLELLERYYQYQKEIQDKSNQITKLQKENEHWKNKFEKELEDNRKNSCELLKQDLVIREKNKQIDLMSEYIYNTQMECNIYYKDKEEVKNKFAKM